MIEHIKMTYFGSSQENLELFGPQNKQSIINYNKKSQVHTDIHKQLNKWKL